MQTETPFPEREDAEETYTLGDKSDYKLLFDRVLSYARETVTDPEGGQFRQRIRWWSALALLRSLASSPAAAASTLRNRAFAAIAFVTTLSSMASAILFVEVANADLFGVAIGISLPILVVSFVVVPIYSCSVLNLRITKYISVCLLQLISPLLIFVFFLMSWKVMTQYMSLIQLLLCMVCSVVVVGISYWFLAFNKNFDVQA